MRFFAMDLRRTMTVAIMTIAVLAVVAAGALIGLTTLLHRASTQSAFAADDVRLAEALQRGLLLHDRLRTDQPARAQVAQRLRDRLTTLRSQIMLDSERAALDATAESVTAYLSADEAGASENERAGRYGTAFASAERLVALEAEVAQAASAKVRHYDELGDVLGASVAALVVAASAFIVWWIHARALRPLVALAATMRKFGEGMTEERASEEGPAEVAEMAVRFNEMAAAIARQRKDRQTFIAGVAHDLRNPLSVLRMSTDVVSREDGDMPPERLKKVLGAVSRQVDRLERMVGDLLDSVSIEAGNVRLRLEDHDARAIVTEVVGLYAPSRTSHTIELDVPERAIPLRCDAMRVEQVLSNLMSNAIKYSPKGGRVLVQVEAQDGEVAFRVRDEGVGMTPEDAAKAFEPFRRSSTLRDQVPGSGLGLFVVRRLVEAHGGRIDVRTSLGGGSTFEVRLPAETA